MHKRRFSPGGVVQELGQLRKCAEADSCQAAGPGDDPVRRRDGAGGGEGSERPRDEEDAQLVGPHVVRDGGGDRGRDIRLDWQGSQARCRPRRRLVLRRLRRLGDALRLLLHRVRCRNPGGR